MYFCEMLIYVKSPLYQLEEMWEICFCSSAVQAVSIFMGQTSQPPGGAHVAVLLIERWGIEAAKHSLGKLTNLVNSECH